MDVIQEHGPQAPYLTLSIPQALSLPAPPEPEQRDYPDLLALIRHRAKYQGDRLAVGFAETVDESASEWSCSTLSESTIALEIPSAYTR